MSPKADRLERRKTKGQAITVPSKSQVVRRAIARAIVSLMKQYSRRYLHLVMLKNSKIDSRAQQEQTMCDFALADALSDYLDAF